MRLYANVALYVLLAFLTGCASTTREGLQKTDRREEIVIAEKLSTVTYRGLNVRCEEGLIPGTYTAEREDSTGVYYFGSGRSVWNTNEAIQKVPRLHVGGIYLPKDASKPPRIFYLFETEVHTTQNVDTYVQQRIVSASAMPSPGSSVGTTVAGNVIGGALVSAMLEAGVGQVQMFPAIVDKAIAEKMAANRRRSQ